MNLMFLLFSLTFPAALEVESLEWKLINERAGIHIFEAEVQNRSVVAVAGRAVIEAPLKSVVDVLMDIDQRKSWAPNLADARILERKTEHEWIEYNHIATPFFVSDRDFVVAARVQSNPRRSGTWSIHYESTAHTKEPKTSFVRGVVYRATFQLKKLGFDRTEIWAEAFVDPKGAIPKWIVNIFQRKWPHRAISALQKQVSRRKDQKDFK